MSDLVHPVCSYSSLKIGTSSSTQVGEPSISFICRWLNATTATSLMLVPSEVLLVGLVVRVRLPGRAEVLDVVQVGGPLLAGLPDRLHPHAHPHVGGVALEDQV